MEDLWKSLSANKSDTCSFTKVFSALWHYSPQSLPKERKKDSTNVNSASTSYSHSTSQNTVIDADPHASLRNTNTDYDSHKLAVQYAIGCTSKYDEVTYNDIALFIERFGPLKGSPPICVLRARASLISEHSNNTSTNTNNSNNDDARRLVRWYHGDISRTQAQKALTKSASKGGTTRYLVRWSRSKASHLVLSMASHPAFSMNDDDEDNEDDTSTTTNSTITKEASIQKKRKSSIKNWKIRCLSSGEGFILNNNDNKIYSDLRSLLSSLGMVAPFFQPCTSSLWSIIDPINAVDTCLMRLPTCIPSNALETKYLGPTPSVDDAQLRAGIKAFEWDIDEAVILFEDVYRRNRSAIDLRAILSCARSLGNLGNAQQKKGKGEVAVRYFEECLQLLRQLLIGRVGAKAMNSKNSSGSGSGSGNNEGGKRETSNDSEETSSNEDNVDYYDGDVRISKSDLNRIKLSDINDQKRKSIIKIKDIIQKEANIVANLCVVTSHILQITPGKVHTDERKAQIAVQFASCLGEELGLSGNRENSATPLSSTTRAKTLERHSLLLKSTGIQLSWVQGLASKLLEDGFQMKEDGKVLSAAHMFFQAVCISRLTSQPTLEALALESLAGIEDIPIVIFLRLWSTCGQEYWSSGISSDGVFVTPSGTFKCKRAGGLANKLCQFETKEQHGHHRHVTSTILRATSSNEKTNNKNLSTGQRLSVV